MKQQLINTWILHNSKNILLIEAIAADTLAVASTPRSRTVSQQLVHMHNNRIAWLEFIAKKHYSKTMLLDTTAAIEKSLLLQAFQQSADTIKAVIEESWENGGKLPNFKSGLIPFIGYLISHESHHRGAIVLTIKQSGVKLSDSLKWGLWEWK